MEKYYTIDHDTILSERIDNETVIINLNTGCYYNLNPTASYLWILADNGFSLDEITKSYVFSYKMQKDAALIEIETVFSNLISFGLLTTSHLIPKPNKVRIDAPQYILPVIEKFDDMQEMLLLDPIHEVTEKGWPYKNDE